MNQDPYQGPAAPAVYQQSEGYISPRAAWELLGTQGWVRFVSVCFFIVTALMLFGSVNMLMEASRRSSVYESSYDRAAPGYLMWPALIILVMALLYLYPAVLLAKYSSAIRRFRYSASMADLEAALRHQRMVWRFIGIMFIIGIGFFVISFLVSLGSRRF